MALTDPLFPSFSQDVVAVFDESFNQVFPGARPMKATVNERSKIMEHPVETGSTIADHHIFDPTEIELSFMLLSVNLLEDYRSVYQQIKQTYKASTILTIQTRTDSYANMVIYEMPHDESPELFDSILLACKLREVDFRDPQFGALPASQVQNKKQASTVERGEQQTTETEPQKKGSVLKQIEGYFKPQAATP